VRRAAGRVVAAGSVGEADLTNDQVCRLVALCNKSTLGRGLGARELTGAGAGRVPRHTDSLAR